jgi:hypothetical protein
MNARASLGALLTAGLLSVPSSAEARSCGGPIPSSVALRASTVVFVGTVERVDRPQPSSHTHADGSITVGLAPGPEIVTFAVTRGFRGVAESRVRITQIGGVSGDIAFGLEEKWLVYASDPGGDRTTTACSRTRLLAHAGEDLKYLEGLAVKKPQGLVYGDVFQQVAGPDGRPAQRALFEVLQVVALGTAERFTVDTDRWGPYQLVLPPGNFQIWVERKGLPVTSPAAVRIGDGDEQKIAFSAQFP